MPGEPWLILPTYNEAENVEAMLSAAGDVLAAAAPDGFRILVVDDGSPDGTGELADAMAAEHDWVQVLHRDREERDRARPTWPAFAMRWTHGAGYVMEMDCGLLPRPRGPRPPARRGRAPAPTSRSARATSRAAA